MKYRLSCLAAILFGLTAMSALADDDPMKPIAQALPDALTFSGELTTLGQIDVFRFSVNTAGLVLFDVLAEEYKSTPGAAGLTRPDYDYTNNRWDPNTYNDHNNDGVASFLDTQLFLFHDDGSLDVSDNIEQTAIPSTGTTEPMADINDNFGIFSSWGDDRNTSSNEGLDPYALYNLAIGDYILAIGAQEGPGPFTPSDVVDGSNPEVYSCNEGSECSSLGTYRIDLFAATGSVVENQLIATPIPAALPLFASALAFMGFSGWSRRKNLG